MHVQGFDAAPGVCVVGGAAQAFGDEGPGVGDVGDAGVHGERAGVPDEVVDGLGVWAARRGCGGCAGVLGCEETLGDPLGCCAAVEGAVEWGEEVVDVAVEGDHA